jgi:hypothetical protein
LRPQEKAACRWMHDLADTELQKTTGATQMHFQTQAAASKDRSVLEQDTVRTRLVTVKIPSAQCLSTLARAVLNCQSL